VENLGILNNT